MRALRSLAPVLALPVLLTLAGCAGGGLTPPVPTPPRVTSISPSGGSIGDPGAPITFSATLQGTATAWSWTFGGGASPNMSSVVSPTVTLLTPGSYIGTVIASNAEGDSDPFTFSYYIGAIGGVPVIQLVDPSGPVALGRPGVAITFGAVVTGTPTAWQWNFGAGVTPSSSTDPMPRVTLATPGTFAGTVIASNSAGDSAPFDFSYVVAPPLAAPIITAVTPSGAVGIPGQSVQFAATADGVTETWAWDFGAGATPGLSPETAPLVILGPAGTYSGSVTSTNDAGTSEQFVFQYTVSAVPTVPTISGVIPGGSPTRIIGAQARFNALVAGGPPTSWTWNFGAGATPSTATVSEPIITFSQLGSFNGSVIVTGAAGASDPFYFTYTVIPLPIRPTITAVTPSEAIFGKPGDEVMLMATAAGSEPFDWLWDFGEGVSPRYSSAVHPIITLGPDGVYAGNVRATNAAGTSNPFAFSYEILSPPEITAVGTVDGGSVVEGIPTTLAAIAAGGRITSWAWDFGPHATPRFSSAKEPRVSFGIAMTHPGSVLVSNALGQDHFSFGISAQSLPPVITSVEFNGNEDGGRGFKLQLLAEVSVPILVDSYEWEFDGGAPPVTTTSRMVTFVLTGADGTYKGSVIAHGPYGSTAPFPFEFTIEGGSETPGWTMHSIVENGPSQAPSWVIVGGTPLVAWAGGRVYFARAHTASPRSSADWDLYQLSDSPVRTPTLIVHDGLPLLAFSTDGQITVARSVVASPASPTDWITHLAIDTPDDPPLSQHSQIGDFAIVGGRPALTWREGVNSSGGMPLNYSRSLVNLPDSTDDWQTHQVTPDVNLIRSALTERQGRPVLAYFQRVPAQNNGGYLLDLPLLEATSAEPSTATDWTTIGSLKHVATWQSESPVLRLVTVGDVVYGGYSTWPYPGSSSVRQARWFHEDATVADGLVADALVAIYDDPTSFSMILHDGRLASCIGQGIYRATQPGPIAPFELSRLDMQHATLGAEGPRLAWIGRGPTGGLIYAVANNDW